MTEIETYDGIAAEDWNDELRKTFLENRKHLYATWALFGTPDTLLDVGSGNGALVARCRQLGIQAFGVDQLVYFDDDSPFDKGWFAHANLTQPWNLRNIDGAPSTVDIVLCWEVAEHIPAEYHEILCDTCANHLHRGNKSYLIFTSAHPGQGGSEHIASRPQIYWREMFHKRGLNYMDGISKQLALIWSHLNTSLYWLASNVQVFERG